MTYRKKLIEVALPLEEINAAAAREKSIRHGHPSTLHLWWARRPLASCRAVLFASIIDDPEQDGVPPTLLERIDKLPIPQQYRPEWPSLTEAEQRRKKLFGFIALLVKWESSNDADVLATAHELIRAACAPPLPPETDSFDIINEEGHKFDGYAEFGYRSGSERGGPEILWEAVGPVIEEYRHTGVWHGTHRQLRGALFYLLRSFRFGSMGGDPEGADWREFQTLYTTIRDRWAEVEPDLPPVLDPFAGGGSIPLEAQRLGLEAHASDLNPVAVLLNKAQIEIPPKFANQPPVNPDARGAGGKELKSWTGAQGLADDVRYYGKWMRAEAEKRIGHLYPKATLPNEYGGGEATVIAWIWARTVASSNPAARGAHVPLVRSFALSTKKGKEAWVEPVVDTATMTYRFEVRTVADFPNGKAREATIGKRGGTCVLTGAPMDLKYVRAEAMAGRMGARLMAVVAEGKRERIYLAPTEEHERIALSAIPLWKPDAELPKQALGFRVQGYGMVTWANLFTARQLTALSTFALLVEEARSKVKMDFLTAKAAFPTASIDNAQDYAGAVATYLGFAVSKSADYWSSFCIWRSDPKNLGIGHVFARQAIPMTWDYAEANALSDSSGNWSNNLGWTIRAIEELQGLGAVSAHQQDAVTHGQGWKRYLIVTDPPYYDNVSYADLSDFFYVWLRHTLGDTYPDLFGTMLTPKAPELIADPFRHGSKDASHEFFEQGMGRVFSRMCETADTNYPISVIYAFKQTEGDSDSTNIEEVIYVPPTIVGGNVLTVPTGRGKTKAALDFVPATASTGWETMLEALIGAGHQITGTWPMRTELANRTRGQNSNALASSIALVCRPRAAARTITRPDFQRTLKRELPLLFAPFNKATSPPWTYSRVPSALAWRSFHATNPCWKPAASP